MSEENNPMVKLGIINKIVKVENDLKRPMSYGELADFIIARENSSKALVGELVEALKGMINSHGIHGPCRNNNCRSCGSYYEKAKEALKKATEQIKLDA